jgi:hypothetical protein
MAKAKEDLELILKFLTQNDSPIKFRELIKQLFGEEKRFYVYQCKKCNELIYKYPEINTKRRYAHTTKNGICRSILKPIKQGKGFKTVERGDISNGYKLKCAENRVRKNLKKYKELFPIILDKSKFYAINYDLLIDKILYELNSQNKVSFELNLTKDERKNFISFVKKALIYAILASNNKDKKYRFDMETFPVDIIKAIARKDEDKLSEDIPHKLHRPCERYFRTVYQRVYELNI